MELKLKALTCNSTAQMSSNRTFMELKYDNREFFQIV